MESSIASSKRCVIWGAAPVKDAVKKYIQPTDYIIAADGGWKSAESLGFSPAQILGILTVQNVQM